MIDSQLSFNESQVEINKLFNTWLELHKEQIENLNRRVKQLEKKVK